MNTFKTNKGITLVALIITIIVLLILTVVAISSITDQGLFTKSQEAVNKYEESRKEEEGKLAGYSSEIDKYLQKDRVYRHAIADFYLKITKDNKIEMGDSNTVYETVEFEYVSVTPDIITIVKEEYGGTIPDSVKDSSRALKIKIGENEWFYLLLSKDEKILYYAGDEFFLEGTDIASNAKVYSGYLGADYIETHIIEISENIGFIILKGNNNIAKIGTIEYCTDITNNWSDINVTNNIGPYTKVILDNSGLPLMVYSETSDAWAETHRHFESNKLKSIEINEIKFTRNKNMKKEEIQQYIEMPFTPN